jgi:hypothetical protein
VKTRFNRTSRRKKLLLKVDASWLGDGSKQFVYGAYLGVALALAVIRLKRIHNFDAPYLFLHHLLSVLLHFVALLCIF